MSSLTFIATKLTANILLETATKCRCYFAYLEKDISQQKHCSFSILSNPLQDATNNLGKNNDDYLNTDKRLWAYRANRNHINYHVDVTYRNPLLY